MNKKVKSRLIYCKKILIPVFVVIVIAYTSLSVAMVVKNNFLSIVLISVVTTILVIGFIFHILHVINNIIKDPDSYKSDSDLDNEAKIRRKKLEEEYKFAGREVKRAVGLIEGNYDSADD